MRKFLFLLATTGLLFSCNNDTKKDDGTALPGEKTTAENISPAALKQTPLQIASKPYEKLLGSYVGPFGANKITMLIITVAGDSVIGRTIVGGNDRPFRVLSVKPVIRILLMRKNPAITRMMVSSTSPSAKVLLIRCSEPGSLLQKDARQKNMSWTVASLNTAPMWVRFPKLPGAC
jgi:hypothetical protein